MIEPGQLLQIPQKKCNRTQLFEVVSVALQLEVRYVGGTSDGRTTSFVVSADKAESYKVDPRSLSTALVLGESSKGLPGAHYWASSASRKVFRIRKASYYNIYTRQYRTFEEAYADAIEPTESGEKRSASYPFRIYKWRP